MHTYTQGCSSIQSVRGRSEGRGAQKQMQSSSQREIKRREGTYPHNPHTHTQVVIQPIRDKSEGEAPTNQCSHRNSKSKKQKRGAQNECSYPSITRQKQNGGARTNECSHPASKRKKLDGGTHKIRPSSSH